MIEGIERYYVAYMLPKEESTESVIKNIKEFFKFLIKYSNIPNYDQPVNVYYLDVTSPLVSLTLYLYSVEPSFYYFLNYEARSFKGYNEDECDDGEVFKCNDPADEDKLDQIIKLSKTLNIPLTEIGRITSSRELILYDKDQKPMNTASGYKHF